jgi:RimJ/RimL family protein N-acetyltransferase
MNFDPQTIQLKNGKFVLVREARLHDAPAILQMVKSYLDNSPYIPKSTSEFRMSLEQEEAWIQSFLDAPNSLLLVAEFENQMIGNIDLTGNKRQVMQHNALVGMGMLIEWRNQGLGSALMQAAIDWAKSNPILENLQLEVYAENLAGINLYQKMRFQKVGIIPKLFKENGKYCDSIMMSLSLKSE